MRALLLAPLALAGCLGVTSQDLGSLANARALDEMAIKRLSPDGGIEAVSVEAIQAARADVRGALAEVCAVERRNKIDAGAGCP